MHEKQCYEDDRSATGGNSTVSFMLETFFVISVRSP